MPPFHPSRALGLPEFRHRIQCFDGACRGPATGDLTWIALDCSLVGEEANSTIHSLGCAIAKLRLGVLHVHPRMMKMIKSIAVTCQEFHSLSRLTFACDNVPEADLCNCFSVLQESKTLQVLCLKGRHELKCQESIEELSQLIGQNKSIQCLCLNVYPGLTLTALVDSLKSNRSLKQLKCRSGSLDTPADYSDLWVFVEVLDHHNFTLTSLQLRPMKWIWKMPQTEAVKIIGLNSSMEVLCHLDQYQDPSGIAYRKKLQGVHNSSMTLWTR